MKTHKDKNIFFEEEMKMKIKFLFQTLINDLILVLDDFLRFLRNSS